MPKHISLEDILTPSEIERARVLYHGYKEAKQEQWEIAKGISFNALITDWLEPKMARINAALGQENDPRYIGYAIEYCLMREEKRSL